MLVEEVSTSLDLLMIQLSNEPHVDACLSIGSLHGIFI